MDKKTAQACTVGHLGSTHMDMVAELGPEHELCFKLISGMSLLVDAWFEGEIHGIRPYLQGEEIPQVLDDDFWEEVAETLKEVDNG